MIDWELVIERNSTLLRRILAALIAMAGLDELGDRGQFTFFPQEGADDDGVALAEKSKLSPALTLPRHLHRAVYRLLRPAEAAMRRLIIVVARDVVAAAPSLPPLQPKCGPLVVHTPICLGLALAPAAPPATTRNLSFALLDPLPDPTAPPFHIRTSGVPRISIPGWTPLFPVAPRREPSPGDPIDAGYIRLRLEALARALDDLPGQARRFARWRARRDAALALNRQGPGRLHRLSPLRPGRAWGLRRPGSPRREHEVDDVLRDLHYFAFEAMERRDTS